MPSYLEVQFTQMWEYYYPNIDLHSEYVFHPTRKYRFDFAHISSKVGIEIQGGRYKKSAHNSVSGLERDCMKSCLAASCNWLLFPFTDSMIGDVKWLNLVAKTIKIRGKL